MDDDKKVFAMYARFGKANIDVDDKPIRSLFAISCALKVKPTLVAQLLGQCDSKLRLGTQ